jgi:GTP-binding protein
LCDARGDRADAAQPIDPPTLSMTFRINDGPLAGTEGDKVQSRVIRDRLFREAEGNVALRMTTNPDNDSFEVAGRGELQLGILIETMRREGFELTVGRPRVVYREPTRTAAVLEPIEEVIIDVDEEHSGIVVQKLSERRAEMIEMRPVRRRAHAAGLPCADPRPDRLPVGAPVGHARHGDHEPAVPRLCAAQGRDPRPRQRRAHLERQGDVGRLRPLVNLEDRGPMMIDPGIRRSTRA